MSIFSTFVFRLAFGLFATIFAISVAEAQSCRSIYASGEVTIRSQQETIDWLNQQGIEFKELFFQDRTYWQVTGPANHPLRWVRMIMKMNDLHNTRVVFDPLLSEGSAARTAFGMIILRPGSSVKDLEDSVRHESTHITGATKSSRNGASPEIIFQTEFLPANEKGRGLLPESESYSDGIKVEEIKTYYKEAMTGGRAEARPFAAYIAKMSVKYFSEAVNVVVRAQNGDARAAAQISGDPKEAEVIIEPEPGKLLKVKLKLRNSDPYRDLDQILEYRKDPSLLYPKILEQLNTPEAIAYYAKILIEPEWLARYPQWQKLIEQNQDR
ncbi:MAG: hypothetical protein AB7H97_11930 [Pseudobdellovibrionaceae bacterium]